MTGRIGKPKSRTGCDTCKIRRIRCTEERPACTKCISTGRKCTYTSTLRHQTSTINPINLSNVAASNSTSLERRCFEYYFHHAAPLLSGTLEHPFWSVYVLQLCRTEPAIWDGIISLSALFERPPITDEPSPTRLINAPAVVRYEYHHDALAWYSRSLAGLRQRINRGVADVNVLLVGTIIYIAIEFLQANYQAVLGLYGRGVRLMQGNVAADSGLKSAVKSMFRRLRTQVLIFSGVSMEGDIHDQPVLNDSFTSIDEARNALFEMISEMKQLLLDIKCHRAQTGSPNIPNSHELAARQAQLEQRLHHWHHLITSSHSPQPGDSTLPTLLMNHTAILLETQTCLNSNEIAYDSQKDAFAKILDYADTLTSSSSSPSAVQSSRSTEAKTKQPFSFELSTFLPLFITALKCRYPDLRRKALHLLSGNNANASASSPSPSVQGMFLCHPAAQLVAIIVALEEGSYQSYTPLKRPDQQEEQDRSARIVDEILARQGRIPSAEERICDFYVSCQSEPELRLPRLPFPPTQEHVDGTGGKSESWLHYRQYTTLSPHNGDAGEPETRKMGFVTRSVRLPDGM